MGTAPQPHRLRTNLRLVKFPPVGTDCRVSARNARRTGSGLAVFGLGAQAARDLPELEDDALATGAAASRRRFDGFPRSNSDPLFERQLQAIADAEFGQDVGRSRRVGFELLPQPADEDAQILHFVGLRRSPDLAQ
jgi:hypothetical protein